VAASLEDLAGRRFGALPVDFSPTDHVAPPRRALGVWVVARPGTAVAPRRPAALGKLGWVPLARTFTRRGDRTSVLRADWPPLFGRSRYAPRPPRYRAMRWGVTTPPSDPLQ
jgi:hypothetical protein